MSFFILSWQILVIDLMALFVQLTLSIPITFAGHAIYPEPLVIAIATMDTIAYYGLLMFAFVLTINRLIVFVSSYWNDKIFSTPNIFWVVGGTWLLNLVFTALINIGCWKSYDSFELHIEYVCRDSIYNTFAYRIIGTVQTSMSTYLAPLMIAIYVFIIIEIRFNITYMIKNWKMPERIKVQNKREISMMIQSGLVCIAIELEQLAWYLPNWLPKDGDTVFMISILLTWFNFFLNSVDAIVIFAFSSLVKEKFKEIISRKQKTRIVTIRRETLNTVASTQSVIRRNSMMANN